ncbi:Fe/S biogenesis protein NfuA [Permianibacter aggregans]|uniref:Fe/S biogenesis protein NfuA n=2 Tax=Permianibacter aggregans TaxID=1510150 RepID=A0A4R6UN34_9GAMM|nr:Fe/S biogenesis protein NfuA [Permianibacter aggregans]
MLKSGMAANVQAPAYGGFGRYDSRHSLVREKMIQISSTAQEHFRKLLAQQTEPDTQIRVFVVNPGTPRAECGVSYCPPSAVEPTDIKLDFDGFSAFVDPDSAPYLEDAQIDLKVETVGSQLTLKAPNAKARKVSADAPLLERINYVLESEINPQLASHGGNVVLVELTQDNIAVLQFGGGCHGCSMVDVTLKQGIEKTLLEQFPELSGVRDATEHATGDNPYYS